MQSIACGYYRDDNKKIRKFKVGISNENDPKLAVEGAPGAPEPNKHLTFVNPIIPFPKKQREIIYIAGPSGSGKSSYACNYIKQFHDEYPKNDIYIFTGIKNDPAIKKLIETHNSDSFTTINIDNDLVNNPIKIDDFKDGDLILFDDVCQIYDQHIKDNIIQLIRELLETGRHKNLYVVITNHVVNPIEKNFGRIIMNELTSLTIFPKSGAVKPIKYCLNTYFGLGNNDIDKILQIKSRWITIQRNFPLTIIYDKGAYIN